jgi:adenosylmethionine-8-amino-7-oxononanoate aminotransferase
MSRQYFMELSLPQPQRTNYITRQHSYHGNTIGALSVSGHLGRREYYTPILTTNVSFVSACNPYRQRLLSESDADFVTRKSVELDAEFKRLGPETVIAFICEPISGAALGCISCVHGYLPAMKAICRKYGALFVLDETMCGMGRSGTLHAWQQEHVPGDLEQDCLPDLQMIGKGLGGGYQPIAGVIVGKEVVAVVGSGTGSFIHGQTYQAHPVACAASLAVQRIIRREGLLPNVQKQGVYLSQLLQNKLGSHRNVGDIRGKGLFWAIEFVQNKETKVPFRKALNVASTISEIALKFFKITLYPGQGTSNGVDGDHVLVAPAYNITGDAVDYIVHQLVSAVDAFFLRQASGSELGGLLGNELEGVRPDSSRGTIQG